MFTGSSCLLPTDLYITHVHRKAPADIYFPEIDMNIWKIVEKEEFPVSETLAIPYTYVIYERIIPNPDSEIR